MRLLLDPETGEQLEVLDEASLVSDAEPYDYAQYRRATATVSREHRAAINKSEITGKALSHAEGKYHKELALAVGRLKVEHGSTIAETLAKGDEKVRAAKEARDASAVKDRAAMERIRLCRDDRAAALTLGAWSRESQGTAWTT